MGNIQLLASPFYQLDVFAPGLVVTALFCRFDSKLLITIQFQVFILWMLVSLIFGLFVDKRWTYFWQAGLSFAELYALFLIVVVLIEKIKQSDSGDAAWGPMGLVTMFAALMAISAVINGLISLAGMA